MTHQVKKNGPSAAAILAVGIACTVLAAVTILAESSPAVKQWLIWYQPVGSLSGETTITVLAWLGLWFFLNFRWKEKELSGFDLILRWTWSLILLGFLGTFPPIFELFARH